MRAPTNAKLETILPVLVSGKIQEAIDHVKFIRDLDQNETVFPWECLHYIQSFRAGLTIQDIVQNAFKECIPLNFSALKETLLTLYWKGNLKNESEFRQCIENPQWLPTAYSRLKKPIVEINIEREPFLIQVALYIAPLIIFFGTTRFFGRLDQDVWDQLIALLLFPQAYFICKGLFCGLVHAVLRRRAPRLAVHFSPFGFYFEESSLSPSKVSIMEYLVRMAFVLSTGFMLFEFFAKSDKLLFVEFGPYFCALVICSSLLLDKKSDLSDFYHSVESHGTNEIDTFTSSVANTIFGISAILYIVLSFLFCLHSVVLMFSPLTWPAPEHLLRILFLALSIFVFFDLFDGIEFLMRQIENWVKFSIGERRTASLDGFESNAKLIKHLRSAFLLKDLPVEMLDLLAQEAKIKRHPRGSRIFKEGDQTTELYILLSGRIGIYKNEGQSKGYQALELRAGATFGEEGFFLGKRRSSSAFCMAPCTVLRISRPPAFEIFGRLSNEEVDLFKRRISALQALSHSNVFRDAPCETLMKVIQKAKSMDAKKGTTIININDRPDGIWILVEGQCQVTLEDGSHQNLGPKDIFGETNVIWNTPFTSQVIARQPSSFLRINIPDIWNVLSQNINLGISLQRLGMRRLEGRTHVK